MYRYQTAVALREILAGPITPGGFLRDDDLQEQLRQQVFAVVDDLKRMDWPPERVIIAVKQIARDGGLSPSLQFVQAEASLSSGDAVLAKIVRWAIDRYYANG
jgi:hypothetical protein